MLTAKGISDKGIPGAKLADSAVASGKIADGAVISAKLASNAVTSAKIADGTIVKADLAAALHPYMQDGAVLATGVWLMRSDQTAWLAQKVSAQPRGIVLVFSAYHSTAGVSDSYFCSFFVPKQLVAKHSGKGQMFSAISYDKKVMLKYLYIYDDRIVGEANNDKAGTTPGGISYDNGLYVLRYVIGV